MRQLIKKLFGTKIEEDFLDKASDTWEDIPQSQVGTDWGQWLQEEPAAPRKRKISVRDKTIPNLLMMTKDAEPEERQSNIMPPPSAMRPKVRQQPRPSKEAQAQPSQAPQPRARIASLPPQDRKWREVLSSYAEHLTDEELKEIRKQMT